MNREALAGTATVRMAATVRMDQSPGKAPNSSNHTHLCSRDSCVGSRHATLPMRHLAPLLLGGHYYILREKCERNIRYETNY